MYLHFIHIYKNTHTHVQTFWASRATLVCMLILCCCHWLRYISECRLSFRVLPHHLYTFYSHWHWFSNPKRTGSIKYIQNFTIACPPLVAHIQYIEGIIAISISNANTIEFYIFSVYWSVDLHVLYLRI